MTSPIHVIVLAAGEGRRMNSALPKVLQPLGGKPLLAHLLDSVRELAPAAIHVVVGAGADRIRAAFGETAGLNFVEQAERLGTGHATARAIPGIPANTRVLVLPGDMPLIRPQTLAGLLQSDADLALLSFVTETPAGYGRILRDADGRVRGIREERDCSAAEQAIEEVNSGVLCAGAAALAGWLARVGNDNRQGEYYLTDCIGLADGDGAAVDAVVCEDPAETLGANDQHQLAVLEAVYQQRRREDLLAAGVRMPAADTVQVRATVSNGRDVLIDAGVILAGRVELGDGVEIGAGCVVRDCRLAAGTRVHPYSVLEETETTGACDIGPFARLRPGTVLAAGVRIGNFVETKNARFADGAKASHLAYVGDARVGAGANLGAGTITCNYDGVNKHATDIGAGAFIGSNSALVAPVRIGDDATVGAGSVISGDAPAGKLTLTRARQHTVDGWRRPRKK